MKFNKEKLSETHKVSETNNSEINKQSMDTREKRITMMEYSAVLMLIFAIIAFALGARFFDKMYKKYNTINKSTVYNGIINKDNENDTLKETQKLMNEIENLYENCYTLDIERENIDEYVLNTKISKKEITAYSLETETMTNLFLDDEELTYCLYKPKGSNNRRNGILNKWLEDNPRWKLGVITNKALYETVEDYIKKQMK